MTQCGLRGWNRARGWSRRAGGDGRDIPESSCPPSGSELGWDGASGPRWRHGGIPAISCGAGGFVLRGTRRWRWWQHQNQPPKPAAPNPVSVIPRLSPSLLQELSFAPSRPRQSHAVVTPLEYQKPFSFFFYPEKKYSVTLSPEQRQQNWSNVTRF